MLTDTKIAALKAPQSGQEEHADTRVIGLRLRIGKKGRKAWILRKRIGKTVINRKLGDYPAMSLAAARKAAEAFLDTLGRENTKDAAKAIAAIDRTFGEVAKLWIDTVAKKKNASWKLQERRLEMHVFPHWRDRKIAGITRKDVSNLLAPIEGIVLPNRVLATIRPVFTFAVKEEYIPASPASLQDKIKEEPRDRVLKMDELVRIWNAAPLCGWPFGHLVRLLMLTGQRRNEVAEMKWVEVSQDDATWIIPKERTKARRAHLVPLSGPALAMLESCPRMGEYVLSSDGRTHVGGFSKGKQALDTYLSATGEPMEPWRLHDLRRSCATHMVERLGTRELVVERVLNHAPKGVTATVYIHTAYAAEKREALDKWAAELMESISPPLPSNVVQINGKR